jgi:hypothetical protein
MPRSVTEGAVIVPIDEVRPDQRCQQRQDQRNRQSQQRRLHARSRAGSPTRGVDFAPRI